MGETGCGRREVIASDDLTRWGDRRGYLFLGLGSRKHYERGELSPTIPGGLGQKKYTEDSDYVEENVPCKAGDQEVDLNHPHPWFGKKCNCNPDSQTKYQNTGKTH